ncbi:C39 family peptidase [Colwellia sp. RSH04]|uniref:C39 family peptidase n=1 Tax=Colwellia sp. RSH04 TaxID=2305464 RepID=UPI000E576103|nr:C39 family peptidase [Colwellia sp. RSH04]RHW76489.1 peptidoglycan-binding protein [Colwellia sp. RSH04]
MRIIKKLIALTFLLSANAIAMCPDGATFDENLGFCANGVDAFGPFTNDMVSGCVSAGGGSACTNTYQYQVQGTTIDVLRWSESFTNNLRGTADCPTGSLRSGTYGGHCFESVSGAPNNVYGNFNQQEVDACNQLNGGTACYTNRWGASFYLAVKDQMASGSTTVENRLGAWLWYIDEDGLNKSHTQLANELSAMGVKRVFIKIADDTSNCSLFTDACSTTTTNIYKNKGIEPWAWSYNYPGDDVAQADALYKAAQYGYVGYVLDVEVEFNNTSAALHNIFQAFESAKQDAINAGLINASFPIGATTWSNPISQGMNVGIIDQYVDFHMPQTYVEVWGASYMANPKQWIEAGNSEYRTLGANKPIWHIVSTEYDNITSSQLSRFIDVAGPNTSIWRVPGGPVPQAVWNDWSALNWQQSTFDNNVANHGNSNDMLPWMAADTSGGGGVTPPVAESVPYYFQLNNYYDPYGTCSVTSLAMVTDLHNFTNPSVTGNTPDYLYEELGGVLQTVPSLANGYNTMAIRAGSSKRADSKTNGTFAELQQALADGKVAIVHGWFTNPGHIMVVTGYDGAHYTVNDPFGRWNEQKWGSYNSSVSGEGQKYSKAAFEYAINDNGQGNDLWLHIFE